MKVKSTPDDFKVKEVIRLRTKKGGHYSYFILKKKEWNTLSAIKEIAKRLKVKPSRIGFAGIKDKHAVTEQYLSFFKIPKEKVEKLNIKDMEFEFVGEGNEAIFIGKLKENEFEIVIRDLEKPLKAETLMPNYFGEQRFGIKNLNAKIGKHLIKQEFKEACQTLKLKVTKNNYVGALKEHGEDKIKLYIHAYTSKLFNQCLREYIKSEDPKAIINKTEFGTLAFPTKEIKNLKIPLLNFDTEFKNKKIEELCLKIIEKEDIIPRDFIVRQFQKTISQSEDRDGFVKVKNLKLGKTTKDELNHGKKKQKVLFTLQKGSYATVLIRQMGLSQ